MATIKIQRTNEYQNKMRAFKIFIDGQEAGTIANGETKDFETKAGKHTVTAKIDWCSSPDIAVDVKEHEIKNLEVGGFKNGKWIMLTGFIIVGLHLILSKTIGFNYTIFLLVPNFLIMIYSLTLGRRKYLTLKEIKE